MKFLMKTLITTASTLFLLQNATAGELSLQGSTTVTANVFEPFQEKLEKETGLKLNVVGNGSSHGVKSVNSGAANIGMISSSVDSMKSKVADAQWDKIQGHEVGIARMAFIVHKSNPVSELTLEQVAGIVSGKIKNWSEVGGANQPIAVVTEVSGGGMRSTVEKKLLDKASMAGNLKELPNGPQIVKVTSQLPIAFGTANGAIADDSVKTIKTDKNIEQPLILLTMGEPNADAEKLIAAIRALEIK